MRIWTIYASCIPNQIVVILTMAFWVHCVDPIEYNAYSDVASNLAINGKLVKGDPSKVTIVAYRAQDYHPSPSQPVVFTTVELLDDQGQRLDIPGVAVGRYELLVPKDHPNFHVEEGSGYAIRLVNGSGEVYISDYEIIQPLPHPIDITVSREIRKTRGRDDLNRTFELLIFDLHTQINHLSDNNRSLLRWEIVHTYALTDSKGQRCYIDLLINDNKVRLLNGYKLDTDDAKLRIWEIEQNCRFGEGAYVNIYQEALSTSAFEYWQNVNTVNNRSGSMFDPPAGKIRGNIHNSMDPKEDVYGFFYAVQQDTFHQYVSPEDAGFPVPCCTEGTDPVLCIDCTTFPKSTLVKPYYWTK